MVKTKVKKNIRAALFFIVGVFLLSIGSVPQAHALTSGGIGGHPAHPDEKVQYSDSWFIYGLKPGEKKDDAVEVVNGSDQPAIMKLYVVDAVSTSDGNFSLADEHADRTEIGSWVTLATTTVTLFPGESRIVPFTVVIPDNADVGEHAGGIIIQKTGTPEIPGAPPTTGGVSSSASIVTRVGIRIYETVPGAIIRDLNITNFSVVRHVVPGKRPTYVMDLSVENKSNVSVSTHLKFDIAGWGKIDYFPKSQAAGGFILSDLTDFFNGQVEKRDWQLFKGQTVSTNWEWPEPVFGRYTIKAVMDYEDNGQTKTVESKSVTVTVIPWTPLMVVLIIVIAIIALLIMRKKLFGTARWMKYTVQSGDDLLALAAAAGVSWKKVMKANRLKDPQLRKGQVLRLPRFFVTTHAAPHAGAAKVASKKVTRRQVSTKHSAAVPPSAAVPAHKRRRTATKRTKPTPIS